MIDVIDVLLDLETSDIATVSFEETLFLTIQNKNVLNKLQTHQRVINEIHTSLIVH